MKVFLGVDTSSYTTSLCLVGQDGAVLADLRRMLNVGPGQRGLRQSEALFQHVQNLPLLGAELGSYLSGKASISAIGVSSKPRAQIDSYMPVFLPGQSLAQSLGHLFGIPCYELSHQENHIWGGLGSSAGPFSERFLAIHLSGGTTELVQVELNLETWRMKVNLWGGTSDLHAGQLVDRLGVGLGLGFPAGPELEQLAQTADSTVPIATFHKAGKISFSGPLTALERLKGEIAPEVLALSSFQVISRTLIKWITWAEQKTQSRELLIVGGVAANKIIRRELEQALPNWNIYFASPEFSTDNAYGAAYYAALASGGLLFPQED
ncbi:MAG: O-sialoglycoprotein endopeptidase [Firmicutes bacterium]|nr:O-sialoglycoprotein endopeptidase [Bacillota bacterium]